MELTKNEAEKGVLMGIVGVLLLGAIISALGAPLGSTMKLGKIIFDLGVAGMLWIFLNEAFESDVSDLYRAALVIGAAILAAFGW
jgi:hypothetical protein